MTKILLPVFFGLLLTSCLLAHTHEDLERGLNSYIGKRQSLEVLKMHYWNVIKTTDTEIELEQNRGDGCSYAILLDSKEKIVKSWRYTSPMESCKKKYYSTGA